MMTAAFYLKRVGGLVECRAMESAVAQGLVREAPQRRRIQITYGEERATTKRPGQLASWYT
ncbi:predicted protein [Plenodomus lingam JN3]|uniref:Predicted protein n=1 Tax=Leptosphaeria maculans (strain JN3 / isolate v23.1.3 / race Av1-4-5-6-7-8) TaxID=985895 RepID=E4ZJD8_LEPMJ|nr:predicted protein [Plenodomus lingam JN3]CBX91569.1 predicted protein [Plenodomus lingam JN3]